MGRICTGKNRCSDNSGQIDCPAEGEDFFGQDWQYARLGFCAPRSFRAETVSGDEIIIDDRLGLEWQRLHYPTSPTDIDRVDWYYAVDYCNDLVYAGHNDWRLPSVKEIFSLKYNPIDLALGDGQGLWTSQESGEDGAIVIFDSYYDSYYYKNNISKDELRAVRCVRGNKIPDADLYSSTVTSGGSSYRIVTDSTTRLIWQKNPEDSTKTWKNALSYCENLEYAGLSNWRLPNNNELMSLINNNGSSNFPEISEVTASDSRKFWTSSSLYETSGGAFALYSFGSWTWDSKTGKNNVVCVHNDPCEEGKFWNGSECVNPCEPNPCGEHSTGVCTATAWNQFECGCDDGYFWKGSECYKGSAPDLNYSDPYGSISISFYANQIRNETDIDTNNGANFGAFATGIYGNGTTSVTPNDVYIMYSAAQYYDRSDSTGVEIYQIPVYEQNSQAIYGEPVLVIEIPAESATVGEHTVSSYPGNTPVQIKFVKYESDGSEIICYHALGEGTINISEVGDIANHGSLGFSGEIPLYSPKNYKGYDISSLLDYPTCDPVE